MYKIFFKRILDLMISLTGLIFTLPLLFVVYLLLNWQNKGTAFFFQERPGKNQEAFKIIKFKTMSEAKDASGMLLPDNQRITKAGKIIRKLSIDELPQLINVLKGDMSLVGPRPLLYKYMTLYSEKQLRRHEVKPGITGWAQVNGRNSISWTKKFEFDIHYVDHVSFLLDAKIIGLTFMKVIKKEGVNQNDERPMQPFDGSN